MTNTDHSSQAPDQPLVYQIRIEGHLGPQWQPWFGEVNMTQEENGDTLITCPVADQAALFGLLRKVRDLSLPLVWVIRLSPQWSEDKR
ncbi:MAG: hypothetical protein GYA17_03725 [Chloroflexi bacterium]|nr:hypothetical protein [Chloroflexota bacterium]